MSFDLSRLRQRLETRELGRRVWFEQVVDSTNDLATAPERRHADVIVADQQRRGRGRNGSVWVAPRGAALLFSISVRLDRPFPLAPLMTLAASVAVCDTVLEHGVDGAHIKWPNDVLVERSKICGILSEARTVPDGSFRGALGIGLNVSQGVLDLPEGATSMALRSRQPMAREEVLAGILRRLEPELDELLAGRAGGLLERWRERSPWQRGHRVLYVAAGSTIDATTDGIDDDGSLFLRLDGGGRVRVLSGPLTFL